MSKHKPFLGITLGDPAGIGPEIICKFFENGTDLNYVPIIYGYKDIVFDTCDFFQIKNYFEVINDISEIRDYKKIYLLDLGEKNQRTVYSKKKNSVQNAHLVLKVLNKIHEDAVSKRIEAVITLPINKNSIQEIEPDFKGHTEYFAKMCNLKPDEVVMILKNDFFKAALAVNHEAVNEISEKIKKEMIYKKIRILYEFLTEKYGVSNPEIAVSGLNPHGNIYGETQSEEVKEIIPAIERLNNESISCDGPFSADTMINTSSIKKYDIFFCMFHDQGLPLLKFLAMNRGVNITAGLPYIRTSVDHGTAFDIAWKNGEAKTESLKAAISEAMIFIGKKGLDEEVQYNVLAQYYDDFMDEIPYAEWAEYIEELIQKYNKSRNEKLQLLDIGCGTGALLEFLDSDKYSILGIDKSSEMINQARRKNIKNSEFRAADILDFNSEKKFDIIISTFDSLNYILDYEDIEKVFSKTYDLINEEGIFIFDITTENNSLEYFYDEIYYNEYESFNYVRHSHYSEDEKIQYTDLTFYSRIADNLYSLTEEFHKQRVYDMKEIEKAFKNSGWQLIKAEDSYTREKADDKSNRICYILEKKS